MLTDVMLPFLRDLGERWAAGRASVAQEHFASSLLRVRLLAIARDWDTSQGPTLLLACLPGEAHDLGLIVFGILTSRRGFRVTHLGADTPIDTLHATVHRIRPSLTVLLATTTTLLTTHASQLRALSAHTPTAIAGLTDLEAMADVGARALPTDIVQAAKSVAP